MRLPYVVTGGAVLATIFLGLVFIAWQSARLDLSQNGEVNGLTNVKQSEQYTFDDPLITTVDEDKALDNEKTKVFVSSEDPALGNANNNVFVIFYGSLLDDTMQRYLAAAERMHDELGDKVTLVWKDNTENETAIQASIVGHCANAVDLFWPYAAALANSTANSLDAFKQIAVDAGVSSIELDTCLSASAYEAQITQSTILAKALEVSNEHAVFVNDDMYSQAVSADVVIAAAKELAN